MDKQMEKLGSTISPQISRRIESFLGDGNKVGNLVTVYSAKSYDREWLERWSADGQLELQFVGDRLGPATVQYAAGSFAICCFVNDDLSGGVLEGLAKLGVRGIALRCAGFDRFDARSPWAAYFDVARVPAYSPEAVAEFAAGLALTVNRRIAAGVARTKLHNFKLEGQLGFVMKGRTVGLIGTGRIGAIAARIFASGFGCKLLCYDPYENQAVKDVGGEYCTLDRLYAESDIISLHIPLMAETRNLICAKSIAKMKKGVIIVNTSRGELIDLSALFDGLQSKQIGGVGLDVISRESALFFEDRTEDVDLDREILALLSLPCVCVTGHQAFFTRESLDQIASITLGNLDAMWNRTTIPANQAVATAQAIYQPSRTPTPRGGD